MGELPGLKDDDAFCANGILAADRTPHPHAAEVEAVYTRGRNNNTLISSPIPPAESTKDRKGTYLMLGGSRKKNGPLQTIDVSGRRFSVTLSAVDGSITSYRYDGRELLAAPLRPNFWRPPTDNDRADLLGARAWQGLDDLHTEVVSISKALTDSLAEVQMLLHLTSPDGNTLRLKQIVEVAPDGALLLSYLVVPGGQFRTLPKLGLQFGLDTAYAACLFYGNIHETYPDRRTAQRVSLWYKKNADLAAPQYVKPQEQGNREAQWVCFRAPDRPDLTLSAPDGLLNFSLRQWSDSTLAAARRWCDVGDPDPYYTVSIDHRQAGLGTATCGPGVAQRYTISGDSTYGYSFILSPGSGPVDHSRTFGHTLHPDLRQPLASTENRRLAVASIKSNRRPASVYSEGFPMVLADGRRAVPGDWHHGWAGFEAPDTVEFTLTLKQYATLGQITVGTSHSPADWVVQPLSAEASWSIDGQRWSPWQEMDLQNPPADRYNDSRRLRYALFPRRARAVRFIKVRFLCRPQLPVWHPYARQNAWLMVDEIELLAPHSNR